jgi:hypothetical protein
MRNVSNKRCGENQNNSFVFSSVFSENCTVYEIILKNLMEPEKPQIAIWQRVAS